MVGQRPTRTTLRVCERFFAKFAAGVKGAKAPWHQNKQARSSSSLHITCVSEGPIHPLPTFACSARVLCPLLPLSASTAHTVWFRNIGQSSSPRGQPDRSVPVDVVSLDACCQSGRSPNTRFTLGEKRVSLCFKLQRTWSRFPSSRHVIADGPNPTSEGRRCHCRCCCCFGFRMAEESTLPSRSRRDTRATVAGPRCCVAATESAHCSLPVRIAY